MKIGIIGGGNMGYAFARALLQKRITSPSQMLIVEHRRPRGNFLAKKLRCVVATVPSKALRNCEVLLLCVKPQDCVETCETLRDFISEKQVIISIMAGITIGMLKKLLPQSGSIVRTMPNLPAEIDKGMTVYFAPRTISPGALRIAEKICSSTGAALRVKQESLLNQATAVSASGPAYVFYLIENMQQAAETLGFNSRDAAFLTYQTLIGATELWRFSGISASELRARVTSKKGTTHAAFTEFERGKLGEVLQRGILKASDRAKELGEQALGRK